MYLILTIEDRQTQSLKMGDVKQKRSGVRSYRYGGNASILPNRQSLAVRERTSIRSGVL
ncbi:hypothetical protein [Chamaesiphon sp.]|uniref:hypothetical protein n=1 Tax=Chamaesiphon sp. TaxID=2814140 RepID=UPI0035938B18